MKYKSHYILEIIIRIVIEKLKNKKDFGKLLGFRNKNINRIFGIQSSRNSPEIEQKMNKSAIGEKG